MMMLAQQRKPLPRNNDVPKAPRTPMNEPTTNKDNFSHIDGACYLFGRHTVLEQLKDSPEQVQKVFISDAARRDRRLEHIVQACEKQSIRWVEVPRNKIDGIVRQYNEQFINEGEEPLFPSAAQGVAALITVQPLLDLPTLIEKVAPLAKNPLIIALDEVMDARNIGAILRVADATGAQGILLPKHRSGSLSPLASKTAVGADKHLAIAQVTNLSSALEDLQKAGYWSVGTVCQAPNGKDVQAYRDVAYNSPTVLVVGNEEKGIRPGVLKRCDFKVTIPQFGRVQSLNVSTATAIVANEISHQLRSVNT